MTEQMSYATLRFNRALTNEEIEQLKLTADTIEVLAAAHHDSGHTVALEM